VEARHWLRDQPGIGEHVEYMRIFLDEGILILGGPFLDDSGGMAVYELPDADIANAKATKDPAVQSGLLNVKVLPWLVPFSRDRI
jgi:uncharacterized protein YciI